MPLGFKSAMLLKNGFKVFQSVEDYKYGLFFYFFKCKIYWLNRITNIIDI